MITSENYFDYQPHYECSGYSSAYVLRSLGEDTDGLELYNDIYNKNNDGTVAPKNLVEFLSEKGYSVNLCSGTILQLKHEISKGNNEISECGSWVSSGTTRTTLHLISLYSG